MGDGDAFARFAASSVGAAIAETATLPTDVVKTRLQVQGTGASAKYSGMLNCMTTTVKEEGAAALWKGLQPALIRQVCYSSLALVLYEPVRNLFVSGDPKEATFPQRLAAGGTAGAISITVFNPTEVLKTQMMSSTGETKTMRGVFTHVWNNQGILGFWAGIRPNIARTFLVNAAELGTYDQAKHQLIPYTGDNFGAHLGASTIAGVASALSSTPVDVVKTRLMNQAGGKAIYSGMLDALMKTLQQEGFLALYSGFVPIVVRKTAWCSAFFVTYEQLRKMINLSK